MTPAAGRHSTRFKFGATHAIDEHDGGIKICEGMALDKRSVAKPDFRASGATTYQSGNAVVEDRVAHRGRKSRPHLRTGCGES